jgi:hypothetical protein
MSLPSPFTTLAYSKKAAFMMYHSELELLQMPFIIKYLISIILLTEHKEQTRETKMRN